MRRLWRQQRSRRQNNRSIINTFFNCRRRRERLQFTTELGVVTISNRRTSTTAPDQRREQQQRHRNWNNRTYCSMYNIGSSSYNLTGQNRRAAHPTTDAAGHHVGGAATPRPACRTSSSSSNSPEQSTDMNNFSQQNTQTHESNSRHAPLPPISRRQCLSSAVDNYQRKNPEPSWNRAVHGTERRIF